MRITITGPRSIGKTTVSKIVARKLNLRYYSSDEIGEKHLKKYGGLDKAIKSGIIGKFIKESSYGLVREVYKKDNFVFDLSGGAVSSKKYAKASQRVRKIAKDNSIIVGLLFSKNIKESVKFLFEREKRRTHFKNTDKKELLAKTKKDYKKFPLLFKELCDFVFYTKGKNPDEIAEEIIRNIKEKPIKRGVNQKFLEYFLKEAKKRRSTRNLEKHWDRRIIKDIIEYEGRKVGLTWHDETNFAKLKNITQAYGIIFNKKDQILLVSIKKGRWGPPGGGPESEDRSFEETLKREVLEEADIEIEKIIPLGYQNAVFLDKPNSDHQQLRYFAAVKKILPQTKDPAYGIIPKRKFINPKDFLKYCPWGNTGKAMIEKALLVKRQVK